VLVGALSPRQGSETNDANDTGVQRLNKFSPIMHLVIFTAMQFLVYFDRGALSQVMGEIGTSHNATDAQLGTLGSSFTAGYMVASPLVALLGQQSTFAPIYCIGVGLLVWCLGNVIFSQLTEPPIGPDGYPEFEEAIWAPMLMARAATGVGEAGFVCLGPPIIDDTAPKASKALYLGIYFMFIFVGQAMGYVVGGLAQKIWPEWPDLKYLFFLEAIAMLPLAILSIVAAKKFCLEHLSEDEEALVTASYAPEHTAVTSPNVEIELESTRSMRRHDGGPSSASAASQNSFWKDLASLAVNPVFAALIFGYIAYQFVMGGVAYWGPYYVQKALGMSKSLSGYAFGGVTVISGVVGTFGGSKLLDVMSGPQDGSETPRPNQRLLAGAKILVIGSFLAWPFLIITALAKSEGFFFFCLLMGQLPLFAMYTSICAAILDAVPESTRGTAMAISALAIHLLGDIPSQSLVGVIADSISEGEQEGPKKAHAMQVAMLCLAGFHIFTVLLFCVSFCLAKRKANATVELAH